MEARWVDVDGLYVGAVDWHPSRDHGHDPVLLAHGLGASTIGWEGIGAPLAHALSTRVTAVDLAGLGRTRLHGRHPDRRTRGTGGVHRQLDGWCDRGRDRPETAGAHPRARPRRPGAASSDTSPAPWSATSRRCAHPRWWCTACSTSSYSRVASSSAGFVAFGDVGSGDAQRELARAMTWWGAVHAAARLDRRQRVHDATSTNAVTYVVTGGGGRKPYPRRASCAGVPHTDASAHVHHFVGVEIRGSGMTLTTVDAKDAAIDQLTITR